MIVLIIDDDKSRQLKLIRFWLNQAEKLGEEMFDYHWIKTCDNLLETLLSNKGISHISFDHDLGTTDVSRELAILYNERPDDFDKAFQDKTVVVHSANPIGAQNIANRLYGICDVSIIPITQM